MLSLLETTIYELLVLFSSIARAAISNTMGTEQLRGASDNVYGGPVILDYFRCNLSATAATCIH